MAWHGGTSATPHFLRHTFGGEGTHFHCCLHAPSSLPHLLLTISSFSLSRYCTKTTWHSLLNMNMSTRQCWLFSARRRLYLAHHHFYLPAVAGVL